mgnify:FL=1|tara:strand:- start:132 stop:485 length:354 start_codon:yes stop_codon:yes gene_type:complete
MLNLNLTFERLQNLSDELILTCIQTVIQMTQTKTPTQRLIERINQKESFKDIAYLCEDFRAFVDEISEWGVDHIGGVDFYGVGFEFNEELDIPMLDRFFASFGCTPENPHPFSHRYN